MNTATKTLIDTYYITTPNYKIEVEGSFINIPSINRQLFYYVDNSNNDSKDKYIISDILTGYKIVMADTLPDAVNEVVKLKDEINEIHTKDYITKAEKEFTILPTYEELQELIKEFESIFNVSVYQMIDQRLYHYLDGRIRIDYTSLDNLFKYELDYNNISLKDYISNKYGARAIEVIQRINHTID